MSSAGPGSAAFEALDVEPDAFDHAARFSVVAVTERLRRAPEADWEPFKAANPDILDGVFFEASYPP